MATPQWERAQFIIKQFLAADKLGAKYNRSAIKRAVENEFQHCHDCLLLAVYGLYKNGRIAGTPHVYRREVDLTGFNGRESLDISHAFQALDVLRKDNQISAVALRKKLGGELSIYSFVAEYFRRGYILNQ